MTTGNLTEHFQEFTQGAIQDQENTTLWGQYQYKLPLSRRILNFCKNSAPCLYFYTRLLEVPENNDLR